MPTATALEHLLGLIRDIDVCMLATSDRSGRLHSRPMMILRGSPEGALWFFTQGNSHVVDDVNAHHSVGLSYVDSAVGRYVSVSGRARVVNDRSKKMELWEQRLAKWLPAGPDDASVVLIRVEVQEAEFWEWGHNAETSVSVEVRSTGGEARNEKIVFQP
jgi:general stress protein 26